MSTDPKSVSPIKEIPSGTSLFQCGKMRCHQESGCSGPLFALVTTYIEDTDQASTQQAGGEPFFTTSNNTLELAITSCTLRNARNPIIHNVGRREYTPLLWMVAASARIIGTLLLRAIKIEILRQGVFLLGEKGGVVCALLRRRTRHNGQQR